MDVCEKMVYVVVVLMECLEMYVIGIVVVVYQGVIEFLGGVVEIVQLVNLGSFVIKYVINIVEMDVLGRWVVVMMVVLWENQEIFVIKCVMFDMKFVVIRIYV